MRSLLWLSLALLVLPRLATAQPGEDAEITEPQGQDAPPPDEAPPAEEPAPEGEGTSSVEPAGDEPAEAPAGIDSNYSVEDMTNVNEEGAPPAKKGAAAPAKGKKPEAKAQAKTSGKKGKGAKNAKAASKGKGAAADAPPITAAEAAKVKPVLIAKDAPAPILPVPLTPVAPFNP